VVRTAQREVQVVVVPAARERLEVVDLDLDVGRRGEAELATLDARGVAEPRTHEREDLALGNPEVRVRANRRERKRYSAAQS
jgi:hypothetical protein